MPSKLSLLGIILGCLLMGCSAPTTAQFPTQTQKKTDVQRNSSPQVLSVPTVGQNLPVSAIATISGEEIKLEVAQTTAQQAIGLMYRKSLADDRGMLFPFEPPQPVAFWMKNTLIPLDMVFIKDGVVQAITANVPPCTSDPCTSYPSFKVIDNVLELRGGLAEKLGLKVGDRITIRPIGSTK